MRQWVMSDAMVSPDAEFQMRYWILVNLVRGRSPADRREDPPHDNGPAPGSAGPTAQRPRIVNGHFVRALSSVQIKVWSCFPI